jgi:hypothetical protein
MIHIVLDSLDWVAKGAVTAVKNQGQCGSCWAFSTTGSLEGALFVATGKLTSLSEQDLVSCDTKVDQGCSGGLMDNAYEFVMENGGICSEDAYPYTSGGGSSGTCQKSCSNVMTITGHTDVPSQDEDALKTAVSRQPVSVAIEADKSVFQLYKSGVFTSTSCGNQLDHGVLVVGYGTQDGTDYWKVKNSWGSSWGQNGYILMAKDISSSAGQCGIAKQPSYPTAGNGPGPQPPSPPSPTPTPPSPPSPSSADYEDPNAGPCNQGEEAVQIQGVSGSFCSPSCASGPCPTNVPAGTTAQPQCALEVQGQTKPTMCALICQQSSKCPANASCKMVQGSIGLCTYDS